jgi:hypothetical protein
MVLGGCPGQLDFVVTAGLPDGAPPVAPVADAASPAPDARRPPPPATDAAVSPPAVPDAGGNPASFCTSTDQVVARILRPRCGTCHDAAVAGFIGLDLVAPGVRERLRQRSTVCAGRVYVVTTPAVGGLFFDKLGATPGCGQRMPSVGAPLDTSEIECLKAWIQANP